MRYAVRGETSRAEIDAAEAAPLTVLIDVVRITRGADIGAQAGLGDRHLLVDGPEPRTLGIENRIEEMRVGERLLQALGVGRSGERHDPDRNQGCLLYTSPSPR